LRLVIDELTWISTVAEGDGWPRLVGEGWEKRHDAMGLGTHHVNSRNSAVATAALLRLPFRYAAYLFIDPKPGPSVSAKNRIGPRFSQQQRPQAGIEPLNRFCLKAQPLQEGAARVLMAEPSRMAEAEKNQHRRQPSPRHREHQAGLSFGIEPDVQMHRRLAESYEALGRSGEAIIHYKQR